MASYGKGGGFNTYKEVQTYQDEWGKPITTVSISHPVISDCSTEHGVVVRAQRIVEVRRSYDIPLKGLLDEYNVHEEWDDHSPRKVHDFFNKIHNEANRPTHPTLLSPPKWITNKPSWRSEDHDSPKYHDFSDNDWEKSGGSPLRDRFEGLHLQDNRGSSPYKYKKDGYEKPSFTRSIDSSKAGHLKDYAEPTKENYPEPTKGMKPLFSPVYSQQPHSPTSNPTPQRKESYPNTAHGAKPLFSPVHTQQPHSPTSNPTPQRKESYPETAHSAKPLFSPVYSRQPHSPTSNPTPQRKERYPETEHGAKPLFSPAQQPHSPTSNPTPQRKEGYPETAHSAKTLFSPAYTPQSHSPTYNPTSQGKETYPEIAHDTNPMFSTQQSHFSTANPTSQNNESYPKKTKGRKSLFSPAAKQQPYPPTSHSTPEMKQSYPDHAAQGWKPSFSPSSPQKEHYNLQMEDHYPDKIQGRKPFQSPYENTQELRFGAIVPPKEAIDSSEARKRYANLKPVSPAQMKYSGTIDSREAVKKYNGAFIP